MDRHVAHYTGQEELADAIQEGLAAAKAGDEQTATVKLGRAVQLAAESGQRRHDAPAARGRRRRRRRAAARSAQAGAEKAAEMTLDTRSTRTVRLGKPRRPPADAEAAPAGRRRHGHVPGRSRLDHRRLLRHLRRPHRGQDGGPGRGRGRRGSGGGGARRPPARHRHPVPVVWRAGRGPVLRVVRLRRRGGRPGGRRPVTLVLSADKAHWDRMVGSGEPAFPDRGARPCRSSSTGDRAMLGRVRTGQPVDVDLPLTGSAGDPGGEPPPVRVRP